MKTPAHHVPAFSYYELLVPNYNRVAGAGIEPASGGYEPPEVPLLYPAISCIVPDFRTHAILEFLVLPEYRLILLDRTVRQML